ncbi:MAG: class I SAM-dependent methyltransferase [Oscillochloris sp.]|nr:class I SAM-dependent methyltransferase [Oscillochloris sp.]
MSDQQFYETFYAQASERDLHWRELVGAVKAQNIIDVTAGLPIQRVIDVGSGTGSVIAHLARHGFAGRFVALDLSEQALSVLRSREDVPGLEEVQVFDGHTLPYPDQSFDLALLSHVIEHIADPAPLIKEAARVARHVVIEVPFEENLHIRLKVGLFRSSYREQIGHVQWFNRKRLRQLLKQECHLVVDRLQMVYLPESTYYFRKQNARRVLVRIQLTFRHILRALSPWLYERLLTDHCIALVHAEW